MRVKQKKNSHEKFLKLLIGIDIEMKVPLLVHKQSNTHIMFHVSLKGCKLLRLKLYERIIWTENGNANPHYTIISISF